MKQGLTLTILGLFLASPHAIAISARRHPGESFEQARDRNMPPKRIWASRDAESLAVRYKDLDLRNLSVVKDPKKLFKTVRDTRFLTSDLDPTFLRRSSWLYPHDGCWVRAAVSRQLAKQENFGDLQKLFIFGSLNVKTLNSESGSVGWWYHVVPIFKNSQGEPMISDPAIEPNKPLKLTEWILRQTDEVEKVSLALCSPETYLPTDDCETEGSSKEQEAAIDQSYFLDLEWENLELLGRNPKKELAEAPPWLPSLTRSLLGLLD